MPGGGSRVFLRVTTLTLLRHAARVRLVAASASLVTHTHHAPNVGVAIVAGPRDDCRLMRQAPVAALARGVTGASGGQGHLALVATFT